jgi:hypothetical protein
MLLLALNGFGNGRLVNDFPAYEQATFRMFLDIIKITLQCAYALNHDRFLDRLSNPQEPMVILTALNVPMQGLRRGFMALPKKGFWPIV